MTGANSAVGLRSMPVRYLFLDEVDGYPLDVEGEGDAISLAEARTRTFARRKILIVSTPTIACASAVEREFEASDQRRYFVPCPHCDHRQWLRFEQLRWERGQPETAAYICESCASRLPSTTRPGCWRTASGRRVRQNKLGARPGFTSPVSTAQWAGAAGSRSPRAWESAAMSDQPIGRRPSRPSRTPNWVRPGSKRAKRPTGNACWSAERITVSARVPAGRPVAHCRSRRAEGSHRSLGLGLRAWQGRLAGGAPDPDGRHRREPKSGRPWPS